MEFCHGFQDFRKVESAIDLLTCPFSFEVEKVPDGLTFSLS
jgi:hypothetical protein